VVLRIAYGIVGIVLGVILMTTERAIQENSVEIKQARNIMAFNAAKLACIRATNANWNKCWVISNEIYEELGK
jgi:hypothetical protein